MLIPFLHFFSSLIFLFPCPFDLFSALNLFSALSSGWLLFSFPQVKQQGVRAGSWKKSFASQISGTLCSQAWRWAQPGLPAPEQILVRETNQEGAEVVALLKHDMTPLGCTAMGSNRSPSHHSLPGPSPRRKSFLISNLYPSCCDSCLLPFGPWMMLSSSLHGHLLNRHSPQFCPARGPGE